MVTAENELLFFILLNLNRQKSLIFSILNSHGDTEKIRFMECSERSTLN